MIKNPTSYVLIHRLTGKRLPIVEIFHSMTAACLFALEHDLHADAVAASGDLFGVIIPDPT